MKEDTFPIKEHENLTIQSYHEITKGINGEQFIRDFEGDKLDSLQQLPRIEKQVRGRISLLENQRIAVQIKVLIFALSAMIPNLMQCSWIVDMVGSAINALWNLAKRLENAFYAEKS